MTVAEYVERARRSAERTSNRAAFCDLTGLTPPMAKESLFTAIAASAAVLPEGGTIVFDYPRGAIPEPEIELTLPEYGLTVYEQAAADGGRNVCTCGLMRRK